MLRGSGAENETRQNRSNYWNREDSTENYLFKNEEIWKTYHTTERKFTLERVKVKVLSTFSESHFCSVQIILKVVCRDDFKTVVPFEISEHNLPKLFRICFQ